MGRMGVPLPELLKAALKKLHPKDEINENID
jgi:phage-related holin